MLLAVILQVRGKCNAISIDKSRKVGVVFEDVIASCELVNCTGVQVRRSSSSSTREPTASRCLWWPCKTWQAQLVVPSNILCLAPGYAR